jgi:potassium-transporting ATPase KdpC subunit
MRELIRETLVSLRATAVVVLLGCVLYPLAVYGIGHTLLRHQADGSLIDRQGTSAAPDDAVGSSLLAQGFKAAEYFHPRPSAAGSGYDATSSSGTNLGPLSDKLLNGVADDPKTKDVDESFAGVKQLVEAYRLENKLSADTLVPADAVTRSASGLDPDISPANAAFQAVRVAAARGASVDEVRALLARETKGRQWGLFGDPRVNVLEINLALDRELPKRSATPRASEGNVAAGPQAAH